jgi:hypothetical protein
LKALTEPKLSSINGRNDARHAVRKARTVQALAQIVHGSSIRAAARAVGVSSRQLHKDLLDPEIQATLTRLYETHVHHLTAMFERSLEVIEEAMCATVCAVRRDGEAITTSEPDHAVRLKAASEVRRLLELVQKFSDRQVLLPDNRLPQWEEFRSMVAAYNGRINAS